MKRHPALIAACYITIYVVWGSTYYFIRQSVATIPPGWVIAIRWTIGGTLLIGIGFASESPTPLLHLGVPLAGEKIFAWLRDKTTPRG